MFSLKISSEKLLFNKEQIAIIIIIINEYGCFEGIVTVADIVETLLGLEIVDEKDTVAYMQQLARDRWVERKNLLGM